MRAFFLAVTLLGGCVHYDETPRVLATAVVGVDGAHLEADGIALDIPAGALGTSTTISIAITQRELDPAYLALSPVYRFEPAGLEFAQPVRVTIDAGGATDGAVMWTSHDDPSVFEFVGFVEDGVGVATTTHFSEAVAVAQGACGGADECDEENDSCDPPPVTESPAVAPLCAMPKMERCRSLCACIPPTSHTPLCAVNPTTPADDTRNFTQSVCPGTPHPDLTPRIFVNGSAMRDSDATYTVAERSCIPCRGWQRVSLMAPRCNCRADVPWASSTPATTDLCPIAINTSNPWGPCPAVLRRYPQESYGVLLREWTAEDDPRDRWLWRAYNGSNGDTRNGHYINYMNQPAQHSCTLYNCQMVEIGWEWQQIDGRVEQCQPFALDMGMRLPLTTAQTEQCRLTDSELDQVRQRRAQCGVPARADENTPLGACMGPPENRTCVGVGMCTEAGMCNCRANGQCYWAQHTVAILTEATEYTGLSSTARDLYGDNPGCPQPTPYNAEDWKGIGRTRPSNAAINNNTTRGHAEGDALIQLATDRGRTPAMQATNPDGTPVPGSNWGAQEPASGIARMGSAQMITDRGACTHTCAPQGITEARRAANLEELTVRSPDGVFVYREGGPPAGVNMTNTAQCSP